MIAANRETDWVCNFPEKNYNEYTTSQLKKHTSQLEKVRHELQVAGKKLSSKSSCKILTFYRYIYIFYIAGITVFSNILY
jgi:hypothetical protein